MLDKDALSDIGFGLPLISRVRFADIDEVEIRYALKLLIDLFQATCLATEGRSSVATENQDARFAGRLREESFQLAG